MAKGHVFCRLCECPVVDGGVPASEVDKDKLADWCLNFLGTELAGEVREEDVFCNFCVWDAQQLLLASQGFGAGNLVKWWPNSRQIDKWKILRRNYMGGKVKCCWVKLDKITLPKEETEARHQCFYCSKKFKFQSSIRPHLRKEHKNAIVRCKLQNCYTYFHTLEERKKHVKEVHEKAKQREIFKCIFCSKTSHGITNHREHVHLMHSNCAIRCKVRGCKLYFKTKADLDSHFLLVHKDKEDKKILKCKLCTYKTNNSRAIRSHFDAHHSNNKTFECDNCKKLCASKRLLKEHIMSAHIFKFCHLCKLNVRVGNFSFHFCNHLCIHCKKVFPCSGLLQAHKLACFESAFQCSKCSKSFQKLYALDYHMKTWHQDQWCNLEYKHLGHKCEPCKWYFKTSKFLQQHISAKHNDANLMLCALCPKKFSRPSALENHLAMKHNLIEKKHECIFCKKKFYFANRWRYHVKSVHTKIRELKDCTLCGKPVDNINGHMLRVHGIK